MKKYLLIFTIGGLLMTSSCDSLNSENTMPDNGVESNLLGDNSSGENLRKSGNLPGNPIGKASKNYDLVENGYFNLMNALPSSKVDKFLSSSRDKESFVVGMMKKSTEIFDKNIQSNGKFLSDYSRRNHLALVEEDHSAGDEHEITYDIAAGVRLNNTRNEASLRVKEMLANFSDRTTFQLFNYTGRPQAAGTDNCGPWCDSIPPVKKPELEETYEFLLGVQRYNADPAQPSSARTELELS